MEWQPIETAPKDGREILCGRFTDEKDKFNGKINVDWYRQPHHGKGYIGWGRFNPKYWPPTHWMPLPKPPEATVQD